MASTTVPVIHPEDLQPSLSDARAFQSDSSAPFFKIILASSFYLMIGLLSGLFSYRVPCLARKV